MGAIDWVNVFSFFVLLSLAATIIFGLKFAKYTESRFYKKAFLISGVMFAIMASADHFFDIVPSSKSEIHSSAEVTQRNNEKATEPKSQAEQPAPASVSETESTLPPTSDIGEKALATNPQVTPSLTGWEVITLPNHPRLAAPIADVRAFYQSIPKPMVDIVDPDKDSPQAILFFQKEYADTSVGRYEQKDFGEVNKIICRVSKTGKQMTFEEIKPILLSYFPIEIVRENFVYKKGVRFYNNTGTVIYVWQYESNGENLYRGKPPYGGNLTVLVQEINGTVAAFCMFYGRHQKVPFMSNADGYEVEDFDIDFSY